MLNVFPKVISVNREMKGVKERTSDVVKKSKKNNVKIKKKECKYNCE